MLLRIWRLAGGSTHADSPESATTSLNRFCRILSPWFYLPGSIASTLDLPCSLETLSLWHVLPISARNGLHLCGSRSASEALAYHFDVKGVANRSHPGLR